MRRWVLYLKDQSEAPILLERSSLKTIPISVEGEKSEQSPQSKVTLLLNQACVLGYGPGVGPGPWSH